MKNVISFVTLVFILLLNIEQIHSQNITVPEPEFINSAIFVHNNQGLRLEKAIPYEVSRRTIASYATGYYADENLKQVRGTASNVRLPVDGTYTFIVRVMSNEFDPYEEIAIIKLEATRSNRVYKAGGTDLLGQQKTGNLDYISFDGRKYGTSSYLIQISQPLEPGEYAIQLRRASDVLNCFGVGEIGDEASQEEALNYEEAKARENNGQKANNFSGYQALNKGNFAAHAGFGIGVEGIPLFFGGDYMVTDDIGIGFDFQYTSWEEEYNGFYDPFSIKYSATVIGLRGTYHFMNAFDIANPQLDMYGGILLGFANVKANNSVGDFAEVSIPGYGIFIGSRYMFNENIGIVGELGYGLVILKAGLTIKF